jgi:hypothetical protein
MMKGTMSTLLLKLIVTPALIGLVSLAGRRWGPSISGWLVGLPLTSGPIVLFLALDQGAAFAARASLGILIGGASVALFCLAYSWLASWLPWWLTLLTSWGVFMAVTWLLQLVTVPLLPAFLGVFAILLLVLRLLPARKGSFPSTTLPWWDIPTRMLIATAFVLLLTGLAPVLGPQLSGLLAPFPIYTTILAVFAHYFQGASAASHLLRGVVLGLFAFVGFFLVVAALIPQAGIPDTFLSATALTLTVQGISLLLLRSQQSKKAKAS